MRFAARTILAIAALMTAGTVTACSSDLTLPSDPGPGGPTDGSAVASIDSAVGSGGSARIEIKLVPGSLVASEVHLEADDNEEKIVSTVSAIDPGSGTVTLDLGGLTVAYGAGTRFRTDEESHESRTAWEAAVRGQLEAGRRPLIEARRNPSGEPQSPSDPTFVAADLRLENDSDEPKIEIFVDGDNLQGGSGTSAVLRVLGLDIQVNGRTETGGPGTGGVLGRVRDDRHLGRCRRGSPDALQRHPGPRQRRDGDQRRRRSVHPGGHGRRGHAGTAGARRGEGNRPVGGAAQR